MTSNCIDVELMPTKWGCNFCLLFLQFRVARVESMLNETLAKCCAKWCSLDYQMPTLFLLIIIVFNFSRT